MTTTTDYEQTIETIHAEAERLAELVAAGTYSRPLLDAYLAAARQRTDWVEPPTGGRVNPAHNQTQPWAKIHADYKSGTGADRKVLGMTEHGTCLLPWFGPQA